MKRTFIVTCILLVTALILHYLPIHGEAAIYDDVIRLHVLAHSDSAEDQTEKLAVRDAILAAWGEPLSRAKSRAEAETVARQHLSDIQKTAEDTLRARGSDRTVCISLTEESYPTREYESFRLPAGTYLSLRVMIGDAEGQNWWCVLYPPLCLATAVDGEIPLTEGEQGIMNTEGEGTYQVRFKILEWLSDLFS